MTDNLAMAIEADEENGPTPIEETSFKLPGVIAQTRNFAQFKFFRQDANTKTMIKSWECQSLTLKIEFHFPEC